MLLKHLFSPLQVNWTDSVQISAVFNLRAVNVETLQTGQMLR